MENSTHVEDTSSDTGPVLYHSISIVFRLRHVNTTDNEVGLSLNSLSPPCSFFFKFRNDHYVPSYMLFN